jgi:DNA-binding protein HU-beta
MRPSSQAGIFSLRRDRCHPRGLKWPYDSGRIDSLPLLAQEPQMNKSELVEVAAKEAEISKAAAERTLSAMIGAVVKAVSKGDSVTLVGFGTFKPAKRAARTGKNPKTGATLKIPATTVPKFSAGAGFKAAVAGKKAAKKK